MSIKLEGGTRFTRLEVDAILGSLLSCSCDSNTMIDQKARDRFELILAEFRKVIAHHRAEGATEERIKNILTASIRLAVQQVEDLELCAWLCDEFSKAAHVAPIVTNYPSTRTLH